MPTIQRTRNVLTAGRWFLIAGLVFYSLMTTTPFVASHSEWQWSGFVLGLIVDAAFIMSLSAESTLARYGITGLGKWPLAFRWVTGLSATFLNIWASVEAKNPVGVAVHLIAPALVMLLAEVGPVYMAALAHAEAVSVPNEPELAEWEREDGAPEAPNEALREAYERYKATVRYADPLDVADEFAREEVTAPAKRLSNADANAIIEEGWKQGIDPEQIAIAATRTAATVRRRYDQFDAERSI